MCTCPLDRRGGALCGPTHAARPVCRKYRYAPATETHRGLALLAWQLWLATLTLLLLSAAAVMGPFDTIALLFCAVIAGFKVVGELQDLRLCNLAISRIPDAALSKGWSVALALLGGLRHWVFLPCMVTDVALVVVARGADALDMSLNTVAILFICELDDILYQLGLPERFKTRVVTEGRVTLNDEEATTLLVSIHSWWWWSPSIRSSHF
eukprot:COSAG06_NODE_23_length_33072_cov_44.622327_42_plen_210_part_00